VGSWEAATHGADGEEKRGEKGSEVSGGSYGGPVARAERKKGGGGSGFRRWVEGKTGERGAPGRGGGQLGWPASAPDQRAWAAPLPRNRGGSERERGSGGVGR
jgi:hypothetical protein